MFHHHGERRQLAASLHHRDTVVKHVTFPEPESLPPPDLLLSAGTPVPVSGGTRDKQQFSCRRVELEVPADAQCGFPMPASSF